MQGRIEIAIADKNPVVRAGLENLISKDSRFNVTGLYSTGAAFLAASEKALFQVAVVGWSLPDIDGGVVLSEIKKRQWPFRVIIYTGETGTDVLRRAIKGGAWGFVSKSEEPSVLLETIITVARGRLSLPYIDIDQLNYDPLGMLTTRERELLAALANGWTNLQIAARTGITRNTVKYHLKNLYDKLGVSNRAMAVALYMSSPRDLH
jgi:DNA-binding NarL/FixJ family response regulator